MDGTTMVVELPRELYDAYCDLTEVYHAFGSDGYLDMRKFRHSGVRVHLLRGLVQRGLVEEEGIGIFKLVQDKEVVREHNRFNGREYKLTDSEDEVETIDDEDMPRSIEERKVQKTVAASARRMPDEQSLRRSLAELSPRELGLLQCCISHTDWSKGRETSRISTKLVYAEGYTRQETSGLLSRLGIYHRAPNYRFPKVLEQLFETQGTKSE